MIKYIIKRLLMIIPIVIGLTFLVFLILSMAPGDPSTTILGSNYTEEAGNEIREQLGLNDPLIVQYVRYLFGIVRGDFGTSYISKEPVITQLAARLPNTLILMLVSMTMAVVVALPIGTYSGVKPNSIGSNIALFFGMAGISLPMFWTGLLFILLFSVKLGWLPSGGVDAGIRSFVLPSLAVCLNYVANSMRSTRSSMLECIRQDYIRTARAKGVPERDVVLHHALPNALMPIITLMGMNVGLLMGGCAVVESVFAIPGTGRMVVEAINNRDTPSLLGAIVVLAICMAVSNLIVDIIYSYLDPRIKAQYVSGRLD